MVCSLVNILHQQRRYNGIHFILICCYGFQLSVRTLCYPGVLSMSLMMVWWFSLAETSFDMSIALLNCTNAIAGLNIFFIIGFLSPSTDSETPCTLAAPLVY